MKPAIGEYSAHTTGFLTVRQEEIIICPIFKFGIIIDIVGIAGSFELLVKPASIFVNDIMRRQVNPSPKPACAVGHLKVAHVHVNDGNHRAHRVHDNRHPRGKIIGPLSEVHLFHERLRCLPLHRRKIDAPFFKDISRLNQARSATATAVVLPKVFMKLTFSVGLFDGCTDLVL